MNEGKPFDFSQGIKYQDFGPKVKPNEDRAGWMTYSDARRILQKAILDDPKVGKNYVVCVKARDFVTITEIEATPPQRAITKIEEL